MIDFTLCSQFTVIHLVWRGGADIIQHCHGGLSPRKPNSLMSWSIIQPVATGDSFNQPTGGSCLGNFAGNQADFSISQADFHRAQRLQGIWRAQSNRAGCWTCLGNHASLPERIFILQHCAYINNHIAFDQHMCSWLMDGNKAQTMNHRL